MWQHHFEFLLLGYGAYLTFSDFCKWRLPDIPDQHIAQMVAGIDVLVFKPDAELRRLARLAIETGVDGAFAEGRSPEEIDAELARARPAGRGSPSSRRSRTRGSTWPRATACTTTTAAGSTTRHPVRVADRLRQRAQAGEQIERPDRGARARARAAGRRLRALLYEEARRAFDELSALSRTVFPYVEEHKFFCDYWFLTRWWNKIREFGGLLAEHGFLEDGRTLPALAPRGRAALTSSC